MKTTPLVLSILMLLLASSKLRAYEIRLELSNAPQKVIYLGYYHGDKQYIVDTAVLEEETGLFKGENDLDEGLYFVLLTKRKFFDLLITEDQKFRLKADCRRIALSIKISGHSENEAFYEILRRNKEISQVQDSGEGDSLQEAEHISRSDLKDQLDAFRNEYLEKNPKAFLSSIILINTDPEIPDSIVSLDSEGSTIHQYEYFKNHYWDNTNFTDYRLTKTPYFVARIERYFADFTSNSWKARLGSCDDLMKVTKGHPQFYKESFQYIAERFHEPEMMGDEAIFVHLVENYMRPGEVFWMTNTEMVRSRNRAEEMSYSLLEKEAPNLILSDTSGQQVPLIEGNADYYILLFYNPGCTRCQSQASDYVKAFRSLPDSLEIKIICVSTEGSREDWMDFVYRKNFDSFHNLTDHKGPGRLRIKYDIYKVPKLFILGGDTRILAKQLKASQIKEFFKFEERRKKALSGSSEDGD